MYASIKDLLASGAGRLEQLVEMGMQSKRVGQKNGPISSLTGLTLG